VAGNSEKEISMFVVWVLVVGLSSFVGMQVLMNGKSLEVPQRGVRRRFDHGG
jgi:hypothetical protein